MYEEPKTWRFRDNPDAPYHATPQCPAILAEHRQYLTLSYGRPRDFWEEEMFGHPAGRPECPTCCPPRLTRCTVIPLHGRGTFHADEECPALDAERAVDHSDLHRRKIVTWMWPSSGHEALVRGAERWERCRVCIPDRRVLYPFGSLRGRAAAA